MGIEATALEYLFMHRDTVRGRTLQLGRQGMHLAPSFNPQHYGYGRELFEKYDSIENYPSVFDSTGHTETLFKFLGAEQVESIDYSDYEQCDIVHDLNKPVPPELHGAYDFIFDGGTIEHIFDIKTVIDNIKKMLKVGGTFMSVNVANNTLGHGFYQFSPEFYRTAFSEAAGFKILSTALVPLTPKPIFHMLPTPKPGQRQEVKTPPHEIFICFAATKIKEVNDAEYQQSDYLPLWGV